VEEGELVLDTNVLVWSLADLGLIELKPRGATYVPDKAVMSEIGAASRAALFLCETGRCLLTRQVKEELGFVLGRIYSIAGHGARKMVSADLDFISGAATTDPTKDPEFEYCDRVVRETLRMHRLSRRLMERGDYSLMLLACIKKRRGEKVTFVTGDAKLAEALLLVTANTEGDGEIEILNIAPSPDNYSFEESVSRLLEEASEKAKKFEWRERVKMFSKVVRPRQLRYRFP